MTEHACVPIKVLTKTGKLVLGDLLPWGSQSYRYLKKKEKDKKALSGTFSSVI